MAAISGAILRARGFTASGFGVSTTVLHLLSTVGTDRQVKIVTTAGGEFTIDVTTHAGAARTLTLQPTLGNTVVSGALIVGGATIGDALTLQSVGGAGNYQAALLSAAGALAGGFYHDGTDEISDVAWKFTDGLRMGAPTGGNKGAGTINVAADVYKNNTAYANPDYVFEKWATGRVRRYADREGAKTYAGLMSLPKLEAYVRRYHHFPRIPRKPMGMFARGDVMLELVEESYLHLFSHERRLRAVERALARRN